MEQDGEGVENVVRRPRLLAGKAIPFDQLGPSEWQGFVYSTMEFLAPKLGATLEGTPSNSTDDGFDAWLRRDQDRAILCVQCKRLTASLGAPLVSVELAKVGMRSALQHSDVRGHYFVTTGKVTRELPRLQRERGFATLRGKAIEAALNHKELEVLRDECQGNGLDVATVVGQYIDGLDTLQIWSGAEYDLRLNSVWSALSDTLEKYFVLESVLRERPRPDIDVAAHLEALAASHRDDWIGLAVAPDPVPDGIRSYAGDDPLAGPLPSQAFPQQGNQQADDSSGSSPTTILEAVFAVESHTCTLLVAPGGGGKSTGMKMAASAAARSCLDEPESRIPIPLALGSYRGDLAAIVHRALGITYGHWTSLAGRFLLLADGLDEVPPEYLPALAEEMDDAATRFDLAAVLTLRNGGLRRSIVLRAASSCWAVRPLTIRQIETYAESKLGPALGAEFLSQLRPRLNTFGASIFSLPFGTAAALQSFKSRRQLPKSFTELVESVVEARFDRNEHRATALPDRLRDASRSLVRALASELAFEFRILRQRATLQRVEAEDAVGSALARLQARRAFGADALTGIDAWTLGAHYEFLVAAGDNVTMGHDLVADHLAGRRLAQSWRDHVEHLHGVIAQDAWVFATTVLQDSDVEPFLEAVGSVDLLLAARCAITRGPAAVALVEPHAVAAIDSEDLFTLASGIAAAGALHTEGTIQKLRWCAANGTRQQQERATVALASVGDLDVARHTLAAADSFASGPFDARGGEIATWSRVPPHVAVALARERLEAAKPESRTALSIETIQALGERADFDLVERVMLSTEHLKVYARAVFCMNELDPERTRRILEPRIGLLVTLDNLHDAELLHSIGGSVGVSGESIRRMTDELNAGGPAAHELIRTLSRLPWESDAAPELRRMFDEQAVDREVLWQLAAAQRISEFDEPAWEAIREGPPEEYGYAARFAFKRGWSECTFATFAEEAMERAKQIATDPTVDRWHLERLLDVSLKAGLTAPIAELLSDVLPAWIHSHRRLRREARVRRDLSPDDTSNASRSPEDFFLDVHLPSFVTYVVAVVGELPRELIRECVHLSMSFADERLLDAYGHLLGFLAPDELDEELESLEDPHDQLRALATAASYCGPTGRRSRLLQGLIPECYDVPAMDKTMADAITGLWGEAVVQELVGAIAAQAPERQYGFEFARATSQAVVQRLSPELVRRVVAPAVSRARTGASRELLEFWCGIGRRRQVATTK